MKKQQAKSLRANRTRSNIQGTADKPRMSVHISNLHISVQLIDDTKGVTLASVTTVGNKTAKGTMTEKAAVIGEAIAAKAKEKKVKTVVFDRGAKKYHGRVQALADAARKAGLEF